jgi:hypothetical protein
MSDIIKDMCQQMIRRDDLICLNSIIFINLKCVTTGLVFFSHKMRPILRHFPFSHYILSFLKVPIIPYLLQIKVIECV